MTKTSKWQDEIIESVQEMSNKELFDYFVSEVIVPDDYDGEWTTEGHWKFQYVEQQLRDRLSDWIKQ